ncbi:MAG: AsnC family transcriptional regulator [Rhodospirillales bacterium]|nr:AsnC family transcriptional regulator [Rhodospirillales bacterium]MDH3793431.1 AsnC family transcriptional regulator [Rhodospirillales bacterium]MDH3910695.1 AsnC family transcriptional regulator [Rhodospirillales bacterium]MDH3920540.1 AsnC family transcriptional regulator [Rhodospirillales bacterium]MDH3966775.1 AsnC family transcriptional regulator [Rhodospirillales bacterium]
MGLNATDLRLIAAIQDGLPLDPRPYARVAEATGLSEREVISRLGRLAEVGVIRRFGVVVHHHELGYRANAMVVWDVPDAEIGEAGRRLAGLPFVSLCYRRPRHLPDWPYNLFCMIHGRDRGAVEALVEEASAAAGLSGRPRDLLFSRKRFKQRGARYAPSAPKLRKAG